MEIWATILGVRGFRPLYKKDTLFSGYFSHDYFAQDTVPVPPLRDLLPQPYIDYFVQMFLSLKFFASKFTFNVTVACN